MIVGMSRKRRLQRLRLRRMIEWADITTQISMMRSPRTSGYNRVPMADVVLA